MIACALFVIKLQGDFCSDLENLVDFIKHRLGLRMSDVWKYESILLPNIPSYIGALPGIIEVMKTTLTLIKIKGVSQSDLMDLWHTIMETYIVDIHRIPSFHSMIIQTLIISCCPENLLVFKLQSLQLEIQSELLKSDHHSRPATPEHRKYPKYQSSKPSPKNT